jgi:hypothetical protein
MQKIEEKIVQMQKNIQLQFQLINVYLVQLKNKIKYFAIKSHIKINFTNF